MPLPDVLGEHRRETEMFVEDSPDPVCVVLIVVVHVSVRHVDVPGVGSVL